MLGELGTDATSTLYRTVYYWTWFIQTSLFFLRNHDFEIVQKSIYMFHKIFFKNIVLTSCNGSSPSKKRDTYDAVISFILLTKHLNTTNLQELYELVQELPQLPLHLLWWCPANIANNTSQAHLTQKNWRNRLEQGYPQFLIWNDNLNCIVSYIHLQLHFSQLHCISFKNMC